MIYPHYQSLLINKIITIKIYINIDKIAQGSIMPYNEFHLELKYLLDLLVLNNYLYIKSIN